MTRILVLFLILLFGQGQAFAFFDIPSRMMDDIRAANEPQKVFSKNLKLYQDFLCAQGGFSQEARFFPPIYTSTPRKNLRLISTAVYFNLLKNHALMDLQKEEIADFKQYLDLQKACGNQAGIKDALEGYTQAQSEYLEYKKAAHMCERQLQNFGAKSIIEEFKLDDFVVDKVISINATPNLDETESDLAEHIQYEYLKIKNLDKRLQKQSQSAFPKDCLSCVQAKYDFIELKKEFVLSKLRFVVYYFSLKEALY